MTKKFEGFFKNVLTDGVVPEGLEVAESDFEGDNKLSVEKIDKDIKRMARDIARATGRDLLEEADRVAKREKRRKDRELN